MPCLAKSFGANSNKPTMIVLHGTAGFTDAESVAYYFQNSTVQASTHFVIGKDGVVVQLGPINYGMWGNGLNDQHFIKKAGNANLYTISIEHVKNHLGANGVPDNMDVLTSAQQDSSFRLVQLLCDTYAIEKHMVDSAGLGIGYHHDLDMANRAYCPGPYPEAAMLEFLMNGDTTVIDASNATVKGDYTFVNPGAPNEQWINKATGKMIHGAILKFYKSYGGNMACGVTYLGRPLTNEISLGIASYDGTFQAYERGIVVYDKANKFDKPLGWDSTLNQVVYVANVGTNLNPAILALQTTITASNAAVTQATKDAGNYNALQVSLDAANAVIKQLQTQIASTVVSASGISDASRNLLNTSISEASAVVATLQALNVEVNKIA
jgi:hypothetical protein